MPLQQTSSGKVRVEWSQPTGGAPLLSSIVHTTNSSGSVWDVPVSAESTSAIITGLTDGEAYTISVEAISQHLSGESKQMNITMGNDNYFHILELVFSFFFHRTISKASRKCTCSG